MLFRSNIFKGLNVLVAWVLPALRVEFSELRSTAVSEISWLGITVGFLSVTEALSDPCCLDFAGMS